MKVCSLTQCLAQVLLASLLMVRQIEGHTHARKTCDCDSLNTYCRMNSRIDFTYTPNTPEFQKLKTIGAGAMGDFEFSMPSQKFKNVNGSRDFSQCRNVPKAEGDRVISTFTTGVVCSEHENNVLHKGGDSGYSRCRMELYRGTEELATSPYQYECLDDFDENTNGVQWLPGRKHLGLHQSATWLPGEVDSWCRDMSNPCTLQFIREFRQPGRDAGDLETYIDCFDFVYDGPADQLMADMEFKMQHGREDKVCDNLDTECNRSSPPARDPAPTPPASNPASPKPSTTTPASSGSQDRAMEFWRKFFSRYN